jgi:hypothetical protein
VDRPRPRVHHHPGQFFSGTTALLVYGVLCGAGCPGPAGAITGDVVRHCASTVGYTSIYTSFVMACNMASVNMWMHYLNANCQYAGCVLDTNYFNYNPNNNFFPNAVMNTYGFPVGQTGADNLAGFCFEVEIDSGGYKNISVDDVQIVGFNCAVGYFNNGTGWCRALPGSSTCAGGTIVEHLVAAADQRVRARVQHRLPAARGLHVRRRAVQCRADDARGGHLRRGGVHLGHLPRAWRAPSTSTRHGHCLAGGALTPSPCAPRPASCPAPCPAATTLRSSFSTAAGTYFSGVASVAADIATSGGTLAGDTVRYCAPTTGYVDIWFSYVSPGAHGLAIANGNVLPCTGCPLNCTLAVPHPQRQTCST